MKIYLKYQLCGLVSLTALFAVGLLGIITWYYSDNLVSELRLGRLEVIASLKAKELTQSLLILLTTSRGLAARSNIVAAVSMPVTSELFIRNWTSTADTFSIILSTYPDILYISVQDKNLSVCYLNITTVQGETVFGPNSSNKRIPDSLNDTAAYNSLAGAPDPINTLVPTEDRSGIHPSDISGDGMFLGPLMHIRPADDVPVYIASLTVPIYNNTTALPSHRNILGFMTIVFNLHSLLDVSWNTQGLSESGQVLLLGPESRVNRWDNSTGEFAVSKADKYKYLLPPKHHPELAFTKQSVTSYPIVLGAWHRAHAKGGVSGADIDTQDASGTKVSVGYSTVSFDPANSSFLLIVEQSHAETFEPMHKLKKIVLSTVFGTVGLILLVTLPTAHFAVRPIRRLHEATKLCGRPPEYREEPNQRPWWVPLGVFGILHRIGNICISDTSNQNSSGCPGNFRIPQKVPLDKHLVNDELTDLVATFNAMTDELLEQYEKLEEKVQQRTEELQQQTILAESANEAKTMFIANVSHELRTPLNGILGMCSLVLEEGNLPAMTRDNLEVVFKSGQLLLHLLTDLITFSKNQVWGAQIKLENSPFRIQDFVSQIMALFGSQAKEKGIELTCEVAPSEGMDFVLIGDLNRILQVVINLISNSLKFTNENGSVQLMIAMESLPNPNSVDLTPYSDISEKQDYMSAPIFFRDSPANSPGETLPSPTRSRSPSNPSSPSSPFRSSRPPLFTRRSTTSGVASPESDITKTFLAHSKKLLNPGTAAAAPGSHIPSQSSSGPATHYVEFRVIDTGPGVPENMQSKIFEPFVQADIGLSRKYGGTGLGLSICQQLAKLMGGDIHLKSFEGAGSTFTLRIPLHLSQQSLPSSSHHQYARSHSLSRRSAHTTSRSLSAFSGPAFSGRSGARDSSQGQDGNLRLVGLSQPFFVPSRTDGEDGDEFQLSNDSPPPPHENSGCRKDQNDYPMTPVTELATPGTETTEPTSGLGFPTTNNSEEIKLMEEKKEDGTPTSKKEGKGGGVGPDLAIRVLVAEDNKINQKLVVKVLELEGVNEVTVVEDGQRAIDLVKDMMEKQMAFDIIFMDIQMPNVDGHEATRKIRALGYKDPIVALTAFAEDSNIKECFESGMDCFLSKPIKRPQIREMVQTYCPDKVAP